MSTPADADPGTAGPQAGRRRVGILGGTFDPPHVGHIVAGVWVRAALGLDEVRLVVANGPWQKTIEGEITPAPDRLALAEAAVDGIEGLIVSDVEVRRGGDSFLVETMEELRASEPDVEFVVILGSDAMAGIRTWHRWEDLVATTRFVRVTRAGDAGDAGVPAQVEAVVVELPRLDVSSSLIRQLVAEGRPIDGLVPPAVGSSIRQRGLYRGIRV